MQPSYFDNDATLPLTRDTARSPHTNAIMSFQIKPGHTYKLVDTKTRVVLHLSMADFKSIAGAPWDASDNQKVWILTPLPRRAVALMCTHYPLVGSGACEYVRCDTLVLPQRRHRTILGCRWGTTSSRACHRDARGDRMGRPS